MNHLRRGLAGALAAFLLAMPLVSLSDTTRVPSLGGGGLTIGSTPISGGATTQVLFNLAGVVSSDADMAFATDTLTVTKLSTGGAPTAANAISVQETAGCITFEGSSSDTIQTRLCVQNPGGSDTTVTFPGLAGSGTVAFIDVAQSFSASQTIAAGNGLVVGSTGEGTIAVRAANTPDAPRLELGATANSWHVTEFADNAFDFNNGPCGTAACADPTVIIHSAVQNTTSYNAIAAWGSARKYHVTLTEVPTNIITIPVAAEVGTAGILYYSIYATDGATPQLRFGSVSVNVTADGATETCVLGTPVETDNSPTGTLTVAIACDTGGSNSVTVTFDPETSLVFTTLEAYVSFDLFGPGLPARP